MAIRIFSALYHAAALWVMAWGFSNLNTLATNEWIEAQLGGHFQFLTIQGLALAWITLFFALTADFIPSLAFAQRAKRLFLMISLPLAMVISSIYWGLLLTFPSLILPPLPSSEPSSSSAAPALARIPLSLDLALHASPALSLVAEFFLMESKYSRHDVVYKAPIMACLFGLWYSNWVEYCAKYNGVFPYPFLTDNSLPGRIAIYVATTIIALTSFRGLNAIHS
ncbi:hypothetical protein SISNIDRAFT_480648 [Sistotremastrum niveocremeum HHB9708]|uniref:FAR-17a/AIG1-like protein n=1 Tax=Sistotremastrum niveocremeum HHB9708 TaxID=1314777 RepID=A0A165AIP8_9AGAM|nr:hypothetical protein SISNIDRAFT_480648 [Sistotremastrum niveocremeum HHB9708]